MGLSLVQRLIRRDGADAFWAGLSEEEKRALAYDWKSWARPEQQMPEGEWRFWLVQGGRGVGKTRQGAEFARHMARTFPGSRGALVAETPAQARDVMVLGDSGVMACCPPKERPEYLKTERLLRWPNGSIAHLYSAFAFEELRGPQHHWAWADEVAKWRHPTEAFDQLNLGLRLGQHPRAILTTTPRPVSLIRKLRKDVRCVVTRGTTYDNADNLAGDFLADVRARYEGTRLGRQELGGELLEDTPGALWHRGPMIDTHRVPAPPYVIAATGEVLKDNKTGRPVPRLDSLTVGVDPSVADNEDTTEEEAGTDACGIVVVGRAGRGLNAHYYVLEDCTVFGSPDEWTRAAVGAYHLWGADKLVAEVNNGGALVEMAIRQAPGGNRVRYEAVTASRGKRTRAEPISLMYEQGRVHHVGHLDELEDELCTWVPGMKSPNRLDAAVWALSDLSQAEDRTARSRKMVG